MRAIELSLYELCPRSVLLVPGMHRALTGSLGLYGVRVGVASELTEANAANSRSFWDLRELRAICNHPLLAAGVEWWKVARFEPEVISHVALEEEGAKLAQIVSALDRRDTRTLKQPRLCLVLPILHDLITNPNCISTFRNSLEVARFLKLCNDFGTSAENDLWESYNCRALEPSENLPRVLASHEALMSRLADTLAELIERLAEFGATHLETRSEDRLGQLIEPSLHCAGASAEELPNLLSPSQLAIWQSYRSGKIFYPKHSASVSRATRQQLFDLESAQHSLQHHSDRARELSGALATSNRTIAELRGQAAALTVELGERQAATRTQEAIIAAHEATIAELRSQAAALTAEVNERRATTKGLEAAIETRDATVRARDDTIRELLNSTSWKVTQPLRVVARASRRSLRTLRRALSVVRRSCTGRTAHVVRPVRSVLAPPRAKAASSKPAAPIETPSAVFRLIRESRHRHSREAPIDPETLKDKKRLKVSVIAWDLAHNPLGRAYLIADVLRNDYDVEIIGSTFPRFGSDIWKPLRDCSRVPIRAFPGDDFPAHFTNMQALAEHIDGDVLFVSKPRLPSLELAILAKMRRSRPIILDIDDHELSFFASREPLSLEQLKANRRTMDVDVPYGEVWTRYSEALIPHVDRITVSNKELKNKYGGTILPHIRDERDFDPALYRRDAIRRALGFASEDRVILFAGTPRMHKGLSRLVSALKELDRPTYKLLVVGSPADGTVTEVLRRVDPNRVTMLPDVPFLDLPGYLCAADLVALLQDEDAPPSAFQIPAKFTDALSMGIPVLASNVPPLVNLANDGLVELLGDASPAQKIDEIFLNYKGRKSRAIVNHCEFERDFSYAANLPTLISLIQECSSQPKAVPRAFRELVEYHQSIFPTAGGLRNSVAEVPISKNGSGNKHYTRPALTRRRADRVRSRSGRCYVDDKLNIVFFWKQNDSGIYGRRQDMFVKYLAQDPRVGRIFHFDAPVGIFQSIGRLSGAAPSRQWSHARLVGRQTLRRRLGLANGGKVKCDTFVYATSGRIPSLLKNLIPAEGDYLDFLGRLFKRHEIGRRRTILWVCPVNFHFSEIQERLGADLVVADVIDDERQWPVCDAYRDKLSRNYQEVLGRSDLVLTNCESVYQSMRTLSHNIHLLPNAVELLEEEAKTWRKPRELRRLTGPVIGYAGNLHIARIDLELLRAVVSQRADWNFVFIGSMHKGDEIRELEKYGNVYFLGVRVYEHALRYIRHFDVAMIPHVDNSLTRSMNPLKLYVYHALFVPVISTPIANIGDFENFVRIGRTSQEFLRAIEDCLRSNPLSRDLPYLRALLQENSWPQRVERVLELIELEFAKPWDTLSPESKVNRWETHGGQIAGHTEPSHRASSDHNKIAASM